MAIYSRAKPDHLLNDYRSWTLKGSQHLPIDAIWINRAGASPRHHRVLPSGEPSIAIRRIWDKAGSISFCELVVCCQYNIGLWHRPPPGEELIALRLKPELAASVFGIDLIDYCDSNPLPVPQKIFDKLDSTRRLAEEGARNDQVARSMFRELMLVQEYPNTANSFVHAAYILRDCQGSHSVKSIAETLNASTRTLQRHFVDNLGVTPKFYARKLRLSHAAILADRSEQVVWADVAAACGFHDQAHMINEYQSLIGLTPSASHRERLGLSDFSNSC